MTETPPRVVLLNNARHHGGERGAGPAMLIWHTSRSDRDSTAKAVIGYLNTTTEKVASYTDVIDRDGTIYQMTAPGFVAWHAGDSAWPHPIPGNGSEDCRPNNGKSVNAISLGICFVNTDGEELTPAQKSSGLWRAEKWMKDYDIPPSLNRGHCEVSPGRKIDPECALNFSMDDWRAQIGALFG